MVNLLIILELLYNNSTTYHNSMYHILSIIPCTSSHESRQSISKMFMLLENAVDDA